MKKLGISNFIKDLNFRNKIMLCILAVIIFLAVTTSFLSRVLFLRVLKDASREKGVAIARSTAVHTAIGILTRNSVRIKELIEKEKGLSKDIAYLFILDSRDEILAHTFEKGFPVELLDVNPAGALNTYNVQTLDTGEGLVDDIVMPVRAEGSLIGAVRVGISQNSIKEEVAVIRNLFIIATFIVTGSGILLAYRVSYLISNPVTRLVKAVQAVHRGDFDIKVDIDSKDEIGTLTRTFNEMVAYLRGQIEEIKRLTAVEERDRIAIELHDGLAQNLFQIITGLEYCEKLFQKDPQKAYNEIGELKENSRRLLQDARRVIFDLKAREIRKN